MRGLPGAGGSAARKPTAEHEHARYSDATTINSQFDTAPAAIDAVCSVAEAIGDRGEVIIDGGIRRGADIVKAIAMGARAVQIGRPIVWGLVVDGEDGVRDVLNLLRDELDVAMALAGCRSIDEITFDLLRPE